MRKMLMLTPKLKEFYFEEIFRLNNSAFTGVERAPRGVFKSEYDAGDVFLCSQDVLEIDRFEPRVVAFAITRPLGRRRFIWAIAVDEKFRGMGIGSELLREITNYYSNTELSLTCNVNNWRAQRLYLALGYRVAKVLHSYYRPDDGIEMRRKS